MNLLARLLGRPNSEAVAWLESDELSTLLHGLNIEGLPNLNLVDQARRLERLIGELDIGNKCSGFIIDGDHAARWEQSFGSPHDGTRSVSV